MDFKVIVPCGLRGEVVSSLKDILGSTCPSLVQVKASMLKHFQNVCGRRVIAYEPLLSIPDSLDGLLSSLSNKV